MFLMSNTFENPADTFPGLGSDSYTAPHWPRACLVTIDMQVDFADGGPAEIPGTSDVARQLGAVAEAFRRAALPIVHLVRLYAPGSSDVDLVRRRDIESGGRLVVPGSAGAAIIPGVASSEAAEGVPLDDEALLTGRPQVLSDQEIILYKPRWGGFYRTSLEAWLREREIDTVVIGGCNLPNCPRATLFEASERDFRAVLIRDAVSQWTPERGADLEGLGVALLSSGDVLAGLHESRMLK
jgi:nicotinamidase-related amidase